MATQTEVYLQGIATHSGSFDFASPETMVGGVRDCCRRYHERQILPVVVGGEHSVTIGAVQGACEVWDDVSVLQLDVHTDVRDEYEGSRFNHACVMSRVAESCPFVQVGIRSMDVFEAEKTKADRLFPSMDKMSFPARETARAAKIFVQMLDDTELRAQYIDRIYDTFIDEEELQSCDQAVQKIADHLPPGVYSSRAFIREMGAYIPDSSCIRMAKRTMYP